MSDPTTQFFCRQPKALELINGAQRNFDALSNFAKPEAVDCKTTTYCSDGSVLGYSQPTEICLVNADNGFTIAKIPEKDVYDIHFSPMGNYICLWSKPILMDKESGVWNNNITVYQILNKKVTDHCSDPVENVKLIGSFSNKNQSGWKPQFTADETLLAKFGATQFEIQFYKLQSITSEINFSREKPSHSLSTKDIGKISNFSISPGKNPSIAIFIPENKGRPAFIKIYNIPSFAQPVSQKQFFKAEKCHFKWNSLGTSVLALVSTDVDSSNKSYYGETTLYLLGIVGSFDQRITLDKEGPIHDISWSPSSREFGVIYGYMPAQTTFFDSRGNSIYSLPPLPRNTILFSPHAKFVLVAGFGNLQGTVDIYDRQNKFTKVTSFEASNTSVCNWSPDGRYILTATTSPRLRVDNGVKIWHASGTLLYIKEFPELFGVQWRPQPLSTFPPLKSLEASTPAHTSAEEYLSKKLAKQKETTAPKRTGAYRPPHARGSAAMSPSSSTSSSSSLYQRELQQNLSSNNNRSSTPGATSSTTRTIPGATPVNVANAESKAAAKNRKKRANKKDTKEDSPSPAPAATSTPATSAATTSSSSNTDDSLVLGGVQSLEDKKIRSLLKKLRAIELLKEKKQNGESLEETQILKIQTEQKVKGELSSLGYQA